MSVIVLVFIALTCDIVSDEVVGGVANRAKFASVGGNLVLLHVNGRKRHAVLAIGHRVVTSESKMCHLSLI